MIEPEKLMRADDRREHERDRDDVVEAAVGHAQT